MSATKIYRIRNKKTGEFYRGGAHGGFGGTGAFYEKPSAAKCVWSHWRRPRNRYMSSWNDPCEIVEFTVTEVAGKTEDLA